MEEYFSIYLEFHRRENIQGNIAYQALFFLLGTYNWLLTLGVVIIIVAIFIRIDSPFIKFFYFHAFDIFNLVFFLVLAERTLRAGLERRIWRRFQTSWLS